MSLLDETLAVLQRLRPTARAKGIELLGVVGSVARGSSRDDSDIDIAYEIVGPATLIGLGKVMSDLQDALGHKIDLVNLQTVRPRTRANMEQDLVRA